MKKWCTVHCTFLYFRVYNSFASAWWRDSWCDILNLEDRSFCMNPHSDLQLQCRHDSSWSLALLVGCGFASSVECQEWQTTYAFPRISIWIQIVQNLIYWGFAYAFHLHLWYSHSTVAEYGFWTTLQTLHVFHHRCILISKMVHKQHNVS